MKPEGTEEAYIKFYRNIDHMRWYLDQPENVMFRGHVLSIIASFEKNPHIPGSLLEVPEHPLNSFAEFDGAELCASQNYAEAESIANEAMAAYNRIQHARRQAMEVTR